MKLNEEDGNVQIRQTWDEASNTMVNFGVCNLIPGLVPNDFREFYEDFATYGKDANKTIDKLEVVNSENGYETIKILLKTPWPIW